MQNETIEIKSRVCAPAGVQAGAQGEGGVQVGAGVQDC